MRSIKRSKRINKGSRRKRKLRGDGAILDFLNKLVAPIANWYANKYVFDNKRITHDDYGNELEFPYTRTTLKGRKKRAI